MDEKDALLLNPLQLSYIGDAVWEIRVRSRLVFQRKNVRHMHAECVDAVNAAAQARSSKIIFPLMNEQELNVFYRGRNAHPHHPSPKHQDPADYAEATGFEAVLGFLYLTGNDERLNELEQFIWENKKERAENEDNNRME